MNVAKAVGRKIQPAISNRLATEDTRRGSEKLVPGTVTSRADGTQPLADDILKGKYVLTASHAASCHPSCHWQSAAVSLIGAELAAPGVKWNTFLMGQEVNCGFEKMRLILNCFKIS